jgi:hypothetical protein
MTEDIQSKWYIGTRGYFRWIVEKILHKKWKTLLIRKFVGGHRVNLSPYLILSHAFELKYSG